MKNTGFRKFLILPIAFFLISYIQAQDSTFAENSDYGNAVILPSEEGVFVLGFKGKGLLETRFDPNTRPGDSLVVQIENGNEDFQVQTSEVTDSLSIISEGIKVTYQKEPFRITYHFKQTWIDFQSGKNYIPGSSYIVSSREDLIPQFVKSGTILPVIKEEREMTDGNLQFHYFYDREVNSSRLNTCENNYGNKIPECIEVKVASGDELLVDVFKQKTAESVEIAEVEVIIRDLDRPVEFIWVNGIKYTGKNYTHKGMLIIPVRFDVREKTEIRVTF